MKKLNYLVISLFFTTALVAQDFDIDKYEIDKKETNKEFDVKSVSGKKSDVRAYQSKKSKVFKASLEKVLKGIENFEDKCNNDYKEKRNFSDKKRDCPVFNNNLVESRIIQIENSKRPLAKGELRHYLVERNIYNRDSFKNYDLIQIFESKNNKGQRVVTLTQKMLSNNEAKKLIKDPIKKESVFINVFGEFILTEISKSETHLEYRYYTETDHWLLNKSISVGEVFEGTAKGLNHLFSGIKEVALKK